MGFAGKFMMDDYDDYAYAYGSFVRAEMLG